MTKKLAVKSRLETPRAQILLGLALLVVVLFMVVFMAATAYVFVPSAKAATLDQATTTHTTSKSKKTTSHAKTSKTRTHATTSHSTTSQAPPGATMTATPTSDDATSTTSDDASSATDDNKGESMTLHGGQEGTVFHTLTVEGEDRIHVDFDRPELHLDIDPTDAPGLDLGSTVDILDRITPDVVAPAVAVSATERSPFTARPWLHQFMTGSLARFQPAVQDVARWKLTIANSAGQSVASYTGSGNPPAIISWDGRTTDGAAALPGVTYSYVFEAFDRAGNKRNFVGQGFVVPAYRRESTEGMMLLFPGAQLGVNDMRRSDDTGPAPIVMEAASWVNQSPHAGGSIRVTGIARSSSRAHALADDAVRALVPCTMGDATRFTSAVETRLDAPEDGVIEVAVGSFPATPSPSSIPSSHSTRGARHTR